ncbi:MAG: ABC transporter permease subunit [Anaeroplasmataceae bacterium]|nr:ABC transporter permease subunit [Anaeroplasmataceae bacterium]
MKKLLVNLIYPLAVVLFVLFVWYLACWWIDVDLILPTPYQAFSNVINYLGDSAFWISLGWTYLRCIESFLIALGIALIGSVLAYVFHNVEKILNPFMAVVRSIPTMSIILILIIVIHPEQTPIVVAGIVICPTLYQAFLTGFHQIDKRLVEMANVYQVSKRSQIVHFYIPSMKPVILENTATAFSLNIKLIIAAEALAQTRNSIGKLMQFAKVNIEIEKLFALTIIAVILSMLSESFIRFLKKVICHD